MTSDRRKLGRFDSVSIGGVAVFGALAVVLTTISQALGLNFPLIPYLQFDMGEVAILLSFFIFGPIPALVSSFIEFVALLAIGQNGPIGPVLKLVSLLSTVVGFWLGTVLARRWSGKTLGKVFAVTVALGIVTRLAVTSVANYYLIAFLGGEYALSGLVAYLGGLFSSIGITLTDSTGGFALILEFTGVFNLLQLLLVSLATYVVIRVPQVRSAKTAGRGAWIYSYLRE